jgi:two-component system chemotaxis response regulator CheB
MNANRDLVVVGASAGGVESLRGLVAALPADLPAAVLIVLHIPARSPSALPAILARSARLPVDSAKHGAPLLRGHIYTAPPDHHLLVSDGEMRLSRGPSENGHRPAVNALFRSAAKARGPRCVGVVLSGSLDDGAAGLGTIVARGGVAVVQDPEDAAYPGMPRAALREVSAPHVTPVSGMARVLTDLVRQQVDPDEVAPMPELATTEADLAAEGEWSAEPETGKMATASAYSCPDCQGVLFALRDTDRYRCRVGHAWTADALLEQKDEELERALWTALRTLDERTSLANRMRADAIERQSTLLAERYARTAEESEQAATTLRAFLRADGRRSVSEEPT